MTLLCCSKILHGKRWRIRSRLWWRFTVRDTSQALNFPTLTVVSCSRSDEHCNKLLIDIMKYDIVRLTTYSLILFKFNL